MKNIGSGKEKGSLDGVEKFSTCTFPGTLFVEPLVRKGKSMLERKSISEICVKGTRALLRASM